MMVCHGGPKGAPVGFKGQMYNRGDVIDNPVVEAEIMRRPHVLKSFTPTPGRIDTGVKAPVLTPFERHPGGFGVPEAP